MSAERTHEFFEIALRQGLLPADTLRELRLEATSRQVDAAALVLQKGLLTPLDVDIVETLRRPDSAIPGYEIQSVLGRGGMGVVYRARQLALDRIVAVKMVLVGHSASATMLARFEQEAQTVARLLHPHIIAAYDFGRHEGRLYFAMEYVEGEDAERYVQRLHPLSERLVWNLIRQTAAGLAHAAESGVVHRDIKPANLLLVTPPRGFPLPPGVPMVKIADFGLAFLSADADERTRLTSEQSTLGSPHYMAPEQLHAGSVVDHRADIYSLGATAFHLLAGRAPFDGQTLPQIIARKLGDRPPALADWRADLTQESMLLVERMMARDPDHRTRGYAELLDQIDRLAVAGSRGSQSTLPWGTPASGTVRSAADSTSVEAVGHDLAGAAGGRNGRRATIAWIGAAFATAIPVGFLTTFSFPIGRPPDSPPDGPSTLKETGWSAELFDGNSLRGWRTLSGAWNPDQDDEGARILAGTGGEILRPILKASGGRGERVPYYRLTVTTRLHEASAVELHFNIVQAGARNVVRMTLDRIAFGRREDSRAPFQPQGEARPLEIGADRLHEIRLERDLARWRIFINDVLMNSVQAQPAADLPEFRLVAEGGPAWFSDMFVEELADGANSRP